MDQLVVSQGGLRGLTQRRMYSTVSMRRCSKEKRDIQLLSGESLEFTWVVRAQSRSMTNEWSVNKEGPSQQSYSFGSFDRRPMADAIFFRVMFQVL